MTKMKRDRKERARKSYHSLNLQGPTMYDILKLVSPKLNLRHLAHFNFFK